MRHHDSIATGSATAGRRFEPKERLADLTESPTRPVARCGPPYAFTSCFLNREPCSDASPIRPFPPKMKDTTSDFRFVVSNEPPALSLATATDASAPTSHSRVPLVNLLSASALLNTRIME